MNHLPCPIHVISSFWRTDIAQGDISSAQVTAAFGTKHRGSEWTSTASDTEKARVSELTSLCKTLAMRCLSNRQLFEMVKSTLSALLDTINKLYEITQNDDDDKLIVRNPVKVKTKDGPKVGGKRYKSHSETKQKQIRKKKD
jgi:hypothetical protein